MSLQYDASGKLIDGTQQMQYNGSTYDVVQNNTQGTLLASAARTATATGPLVTNYNARGIFVKLNITAVPVSPGTGGLGLVMQTGDGSIIVLNFTGKLITTGAFGFMLYPSIGAGTGGVANQTMIQTSSYAVPRTLFISIIANDAQAYTYDVSYSLIL